MAAAPEVVVVAPIASQRFDAGREEAKAISKKRSPASREASSDEKKRKFVEEVAADELSRTVEPLAKYVMLCDEVYSDPFAFMAIAEY